MYLYLFVSSPLYAITACTSIKKNMQKIFGNNFLRLLQKLKSLHSQRGLFCHPSSSKNVHTHDSGYIHSSGYTKAVCVYYSYYYHFRDEWEEPISKVVSGLSG